VAEAGLLPPLVPWVPHDRAVEAEARYPGLHDHPFPECFSCGTARLPGDGLRLRPGPVEGTEGVVAAGWTPHDSLADERGEVPVPVLWAALDCPGGWAVDIAGRPMVLGTMTARVMARPRTGERLVVVGRAVEVSDRKATTATTLYRTAQEVLAVATHVWVTVDPATFGAAP
jgi:acyl-coenzyme A thioesterase PaaI-like protein